MNMHLSRSWARWAFVLALLHVSVAAVDDDGWTVRHERGRCAMRGKCGKQSFLGGQLPCPDNGLAETPDDGLRQRLVELCGDKWADSDVCCTEEQLDVLKSNFDTADQLASSCPACKWNFHNFFCTFTCSPDQSTFVNVTDIDHSKEKPLVLELDNLWTRPSAEGFYNSCSEVKFGPANSRMMAFFGNPKNYTSFLKFMGDKKVLGSPFQINFPEPSEEKFPGMVPSNEPSHPCNTSDPDYQCVCLDCSASCAKLEEVAETRSCRVGAWPCLSFAVVLAYSICLFLLVVAVSGHVAYAKHSKNKNERMRLLQDAAISDDDDEDDDALLVNQPGILTQPTRRYKLNTICDYMFSRLGRTCASFPAITIVTCLVVVGLLSLGWIRFAVETNPVRLWVAPDSNAATEKAFFDENFGPFFRAEQVFLVNDTSSSGPGPVLSTDTIEWWLGVENRVRHMKSSAYGLSLEDVCFNPTEKGCVVQSISGYFQDREFDSGSWATHIKKCAGSPAEQECIPSFGLPLEPNMVLGGWNESVLDAEALVVTWVVNNYAEGDSMLGRAMDWEASLKRLLTDTAAEAEKRGLRLSFSTEISLEQELNKSTNTDAKIVVISYIIMFIYASLALGSTTVTLKTILRNPTVALVESKFMLGVVGIVIVLLSVVASVGLFSAAGVKVTLIIAEVIPFLVLAVGVDNIFLIVHEFERVNASHPDLAVKDRMARALGRMGPSILLSASMETVAFALGTFVGMPAVRNFAAYAAGAVLINAILQVTMFVSVLALNQQRVEAGRADCVPCVRVAPPKDDLDELVLLNEEDSIQRFIRRVYAPMLLGNKAKVAITAIFLGLLTAGLALLPTIPLGLDQRVAIPSDSYLINYFNDLSDYFAVGPPVYFVVRDLNATARKHQLELCSQFRTCKSLSLGNTLTLESERPDVSYLSGSAANWMDTFFSWLDPSHEKCCVNGGTGKPCFADRNPPWNPSLQGMPEGEEFTALLGHWLVSPTDKDCVLGGKAAYGDAVVISNTSLTIRASHFRTSHTPLRTQDDFINAYAAARRISAEIAEENPSLEIFPYSPYYIYFDQYASIVSLTIALIGSAIAVCFLISTVLLGSIQTALVVSITVAMTLVDIGGAMAIAGVSLNAISLVNLVICVGIAVEFCAHIARAFQFPSSRILERSSFSIQPRQSGPTGLTTRGSLSGLAPKPLNGLAMAGALRGRDARAHAALTAVGGSVFSGITITKFVGVCVLAFTRSKIFETYYFRVWVALIIFAALHALVFLPVALSWFGGEGYLDTDSDGGLEDDLARRRGRGVGRSLLQGDDEYDSDEY